MTSTINTAALEAMRKLAAPLYWRYVGQTDTQRAYIMMDDDGAVTADYTTVIGNGVPSAVWHNRVLRWPITPYLSGAAVADLAQDEEIVGLLARVHAGHTIEWDGSNRVGRLTDDAQIASEELAWALTNVAGDVDVWTASDWLRGDMSLTTAVLTAWPVGVSLDAAVTAIKANLPQGTIIDDLCNLRTAVVSMAAEMVEDGDPGLDADHLTVLVAEGAISQDEADGYMGEEA